jgi:hypothetical protein
VVLAVPLHAPERFVATLPATRDASSHAASLLDATARVWRERLSRTEFHLPPESGDSATRCAAPSRGCWSRARDALQPGTRTYQRVDPRRR